MPGAQREAALSWLSQAAYLDFTGRTRLTPVGEIDQILRTSTFNLGNRFAARQSEQLLGLRTSADPTDGFAFVDHLPNTSAGFSATVFKSNGANEYTIAIRGTELSSLSADVLNADILGIALRGRAGDQLISAYRFYKQLITTSGQQVQYSSAELDKLAEIYAQSELAFTAISGALPIAGSVLKQFAVQRFRGELVDSTLETNKGLGAIEVGATVNFTGHSLGGHVSTLLAGMVNQFAEANAVSQVTLGEVVTFNAPGQKEYFTTNTRVDVRAIAGKITNVVAEGGMTVASALRQSEGRRVLVPIEHEPGPVFANHYIVKLSDALAVAELFTELAPEMPEESVHALLRAAAGTGGRTLENLLDALRRTLLGAQVAPTAAESREALYDNIAALRLQDAYQALQGAASIMPIGNLGAAEFANSAKLDFGYLVALETLSPFAIEDSAEQLSKAHPDLHALWQADFAIPQQWARRFNDDYLVDRARYLATVLERNTKDSTSPVVGGDVSYWDVARAVLLRPLTALAGVAFGREDGDAVDSRLVGGTTTRLYGAGGDDELRGGLGRDHLYGDAGDDRLYGKGDDDSLFGGAGADTLNGATGTDKYYFYTGGGADTVVDEAEPAGDAKRQLGEIYFGGANGDIRVAGLFTTTDPDRKHYTFTAGDGSEFVAAYLGDLATATPGNLVLWRADDGSNIVTLTNFVSGDFGILLDPNAPQRTYTDKFGTDQPDNEFILGGPHASSLSSDAPDQKVHGLGGADYILVSHANAQALGGDGNDYAINGPGNQSLFGEGGRDVLVASEGDDRLEGGADDDALQGGADADYLDGGEGHDVLDGGAGADVIAGGEGHDLIFGGGSVTVQIGSWDAFADGSLDWGAVDDSGDVLFRGLVGESNVEGDAGDVISAGPGRDWVFAGDGLDVVSGGDDVDYLVGQAGGDFLDGDDGDDALYGDGAQGDLAGGFGAFAVYTLPHAHGDDSLRGGAGNDFLSGDGGSDELYGGDHDDILVGDSANVAEQFHGSDYLDGGAGNDILLGYGKGDTLFGGEGDDELGGDSSTLSGDLHGDDFLDGEGGNDVLHGDGGADVLFGGAGNDVLDGDASNVAFEFHGDDELDGGDGDDALQGGGGSDWLFGGAGNDSLIGDRPEVPAAFAGDDYLDGAAGNDVLEAGAGNDTLTGGPGNDMLRGQAGDDLYLIRAGSQQEFIDDLEGANVVRFESGVTFAGITVSQITGSDGNAYLYLQHGATDIAYVRAGLTSEAFRYEFADGSVKTAADWRDRLTSFADHFGTSGADLLSGTGLGDFFFPGNGNDTILFGLGSGYDRVAGFGQRPGLAAGLDVVHVTGGLVADDLDVLRDQEGHLTLLLRASGDRIQLDSWSAQASNAHSGYQVMFDDGSGLTAADLMARAIVPGDGNDVLIGGPGADAIDGGPGDDWLYGNNNSNPVNGGADHNVLLGGAGNDRIHGGFGDDVIDGGPGDDILDGSSGADTYRWGAGDGTDLIESGGYGEGNVLELKAGIGPHDVTLMQGSIVVYINATGESLTLEDWYSEVGQPTGHTPYVTVQEFRFADGTVWDATLINEMANHATPFDDELRGIFTADVLHGLGGDDTLKGFSGDDVLYGGDGDDALDGGGGADELVGGAGNDVLTGSGLLAGGAGDDLLVGSGVFLFGAGDGSDRITGGGVIQFAAGIDSLDVRIMSDGAALTVDYGSGKVTIALGTAGDHASHGLGLVRFAGGEEWSREEIVARTEVVPKPLAGGAGDDALVTERRRRRRLFGRRRR